MKRLVFTLALASGLLAMSSFKSNDDSVAPAAARHSFQNSFKNATEVNWSASTNYYKADFALNGQYVSAYYDAEGNTIAITRNISSLQLPIALQASLKKKYDSFWISDLMEVANDSGTSYYITLENADAKLVLKSNGADWNTFKKQRKS